jgi:hypothetical protein
MVSIKSLRPRRIRLVRRSRLVRLIILAVPLGLASLLFWQYCSSHISELPDPPSPDLEAGLLELDLPAQEIYSRDQSAFVLELNYDEQGLLRGWQAAVLKDEADEDRNGEDARLSARKQLTKHPIEELIASGLERWEGMLAR